VDVRQCFGHGCVGVRDQQQTQCNCVYCHNKLVTSSSQDSMENTYHPGGMLMLALEKWVSHIISWGSADETLGCWSYIELVGKHGMQLIIVSAYHVCPQQFDATTIAVTVQQTWLLLQQGVTNPNPRQQFILGIINQIKQWHNRDVEVLIAMDANKNVDDPCSKIAWIFMETDLVDLHHYQYPATPKPATHQQGSNTIDIMLDSPLLASALINACFLPFGEPHLIKGDNRLLGLDFSLNILFGGCTETPAPSLMRGLNSQNELQVPKYCKKVI